MLRIEHLNVSLAGQPLLDGVNLRVQAAEIVTITGVSGSGKSTLLNWLIGNLPPAFRASGELWLDAHRVDGLPPEARGIGILFQDDLLFAHLSVGQNLAFALPASVPHGQRREQVEQTLADIGLAGMHDRDPATLSGGQRARVSLMRNLLAQPRALLLDEPFSRLDTVLRVQFRAFVFEQISRHGIPTLLVTHDPADVPLGGRVQDISAWQGQRSDHA